MQNHDQFGAWDQHLFKCGLRHGCDGNYALRIGRNCLNYISGCLAGPNGFCCCLAHDFGIALGGRCRDQHLICKSEANSLSHGLRPLNEKPICALAHRTPRYCPNCANPITARIAQNGPVWAFSHENIRFCEASYATSVFGAEVSSGTASFASCTSAEKAAGSETANSARLRRSTSIPAALRPWIKRL